MVLFFLYTFEYSVHYFQKKNQKVLKKPTIHEKQFEFKAKSKEEWSTRFAKTRSLVEKQDNNILELLNFKFHNRYS